MTRPFRFGVQCGGDHDRASWRRLVRDIEARGYETVFVPDHYVDTEMAPMVAMAVAAEATERLRVGALVFDNDFKHPAVLAKELATLDRLSDGRVELGIGAGWMRADYEALGLPYDPARVRIERLEEALDVIEGAWRGEPFSLEGRHYTIRDYRGVPRPVQAPRPPILVGGGGERILRLAARRADILGVNPNLRAGTMHPEQAVDSLEARTDTKLAWIRDEAGPRVGEIELQVRHFVARITPDARALAEAMAPAFGVAPEDALRSSLALVGTVEECCEHLIARRERWGFSYIVLGADVYEEFTPVVERLAGT